MRRVPKRRRARRGVPTSSRDKTPPAEHEGHVPLVPESGPAEAIPPPPARRSGAGHRRAAAARPRTEAAELKDAWLRARADVENLRKQAATDVAKAHKYAIEKFAEELLPVKDALESTLAADNASPEALRAGVELTLKQLGAAFDKAQIDEIDPGGREVRPASPPGDGDGRRATSRPTPSSGVPEGLPAQRPRAAPGAGDRGQGAGTASRPEAGVETGTRGGI